MTTAFWSPPTPTTARPRWPTGWPRPASTTWTSTRWPWSTPTGRLVGTSPSSTLLIGLRSDAEVRVGQLIEDEEPVTVGTHAPATEVAERFIEARRLSIVVVDDDRPIGRILADDVVDALVSTKGRFHFPRLFE